MSDQQLSLFGEFTTSYPAALLPPISPAVQEALKDVAKVALKVVVEVDTILAAKGPQEVAPAAEEPQPPAFPWVRPPISTDIPTQMARDAYLWNSQNPDGRASQTQRDYLTQMAEIANKFLPLAKTPELLEVLQQEMETYRQHYVRHQLAILGARSRTASAFVTGPSNFNHRRNNKRMDTEHKRVEEFLAWMEKAERAIRNKLEGPKIISSDRPDAVDALQAQIAKAEAEQEMMVGINKIVKGKKLTQIEKIVKLMADYEITEATARKLFEPDFCGRIGFPSYKLTNNNANIRRMKERAASIAVLQAQESSETEFEGGKVVDNVDENRLQIFYDSKPDAETREKLKARGFRWAPTQGAWQRQRGRGARWAAMEVLGIDLPAPKQKEEE